MCHYKLLAEYRDVLERMLKRGELAYSQAQVQRFLAALPASELDDIKENGPFPLKLTCFNCSTEYAFTREEIGALG